MNIGSKKQDRSNVTQTMTEPETLDRQALESVSGDNAQQDHLAIIEAAQRRRESDLANATSSFIRGLGRSFRSAAL